MKIIDLLNKIANGEELPKRIKMQGEYVFELSKDYEHYYYNEDLEITDLLNHNFSNLNEEIEIIQDPEDIDIQNIEELQEIPYIRTPGTDDSKEDIIKQSNKNIVDIFYKVNDIIKSQNKLLQAVKQLDNKINKKG